MTRKQRTILATVTLCGTALTVFGLWVWRLDRQQQLDVALIAAIKRDDTTAALSALQQGADANAGDLPKRKWDIWKQLEDRWRRRPATPQPEASTALLVLLAQGWYRQEEFIPNVHGENITIARALLSRGATTTARSADGLTPLLCAVLKGYPKTVNLLLDAGTNVEASDSDGTTPLILATLEHRPDIVALLLSRHANVNGRDKFGHTALMFATDSENIRVEECLLAGCPDVNVVDDGGNSALMFAVTTSTPSPAIVRSLLNLHANALEKNAYGETPLSRNRYEQGQRRNAYTEQLRDIHRRRQEISAMLSEAMNTAASHKWSRQRHQ